MKVKHGFTLIEVVVALTIASLAFPALLKAFSQGVNTYSVIENRTTAYYLLRLKMGQVEMTGYPETGKTDGDFGNDSLFKWSTEVIDTDTEGLREINVVITWEEKGQEKSLQLSTYMADRTIQQGEDEEGGTTG
jgi:type II secretion system protein I